MFSFTSKSLGLSIVTLSLLIGSPINAQQTPPPTSTPAPGSGETTTTSQPRFTCQNSNGQYVVMYHPESQPNQYYPWATPTGLGGGWTPERRCSEISRRLESYRPDGLLEMQTAMENGYNTVCVTTERVPSCRIVFTVPPGQDPIATRDRVFQNLTIADSGQQTQGVNTYTGNGRGIPGTGINTKDPLLNDIVKIGNTVLGGANTGNRSSNINLRPFLDPADGGTGAMLQGSNTMRRNSPRLNPGNFR
ncbi:hypothetical protein BST81_08810 [Leptolyngbya sp. 'hensonii']|nr:hypothetical protein BST81_08810 [Leptolyngbya sp. 'hensonii']